MDSEKLIIYCFEIPRKRPNERSECDMEQSTYKYFQYEDCDTKV